VFVSHDLTIIKNLCDRVLLLDKGRIKSIGKPSEVVEDYIKIIRK